MTNLMRSALIIVDVQRGFDDSSWGRRDRPECEANVARLLSAFRRARRPVVFVRHDSVVPGSPLSPGTPGNALREILDGEPDLLVTKSVNSAFYGTPDLHAWLQQMNVTSIVICGVTTNHCCETTARMGGNLGYDVLFVFDATHTFDRKGPDGIIVPAETLALSTAASLHGEFATVVSTEEVVGSVEATNTRPRASPVVSRANADHYVWGPGCDAWRLVQEANLSCIEERMTPSTEERVHRHSRAQQFFYLLEGVITMFLDGEPLRLYAGQGVYIAPGRPHFVRNESSSDVRFLVISHPSTSEDREEL